MTVPAGSHVRVHCDNTTTVLVIRRGGSQSRQLNEIYRQIVTVILKRNITLSAVFLKGCLNITDRPVYNSRTLGLESRQVIQTLTPPPQTDLFATAENRVLPDFVSPFYHPQATAMDAFALDWDQWDTIYLFPPTNLILKVLLKIRSFGGTAYVVAPWWPNRLWFNELQSVSKDHRRLSPDRYQMVAGQKVQAPSLLNDHLHVWTL